MRSRGEGRILLTGSIAGFMPGTYQAVFNGTKAFAFALRAELKDTGVTVTCLMPGTTETDFFERADMLDTKVGQSEKDDPEHRGGQCHSHGTRNDTAHGSIVTSIALGSSENADSVPGQALSSICILNPVHTVSRCRPCRTVNV
jgi:NAD(P)-dependent dehydrogenase (short-subunit alcohol dehydrogenase family)